MFDFLKKLVSKTKPIKKKLKATPAPKKVKLKATPAPKKVKKESEGFFSFAKKIKKGLAKTRENLSGQLTNLFKNKKIDESFFEELEMILLTADVGISVTEKLIEQVRFKVKEGNVYDESELKIILKLCLIEIYYIRNKRYFVIGKFITLPF